MLSRRAAEKSSAAGLALGVWFLFVLVFDLALLAVLVISEGTFSPEALPWLLLLNPADIYRLINLAGFESSSSTVGVMALAGDLPVSSAVLWGCLVAWVVASLALAHWMFARRTA